MTWAFKRQFAYVSFLIIFLLVMAFIVTYPSLHQAPSCMDGKQNGTETGVDCGGSCARACLFQVDQVAVLWSQAFEVVPGRYNAVAYLENHNANTAVEKLHYRFRFADANNVYIGKREGDTYVPPGGRFAVFEPAIDVGNSIPVYTTFEFTETPLWIQVPKDKIDQVKILPTNVQLADPDTNPVLTATLENTSLFTVPDINVVAILYDEKGNAVSTSRTYIESLFKEESKQVTFTWPEPLPAKVVTKEIIPTFNIFTVRIQ